MKSRIQKIMIELVQSRVDKFSNTRNNHKIVNREYINIEKKQNKFEDYINKCKQFQLQK